MNQTNLDQFVRGYIDALLWSEWQETDEGKSIPLDKHYSATDVHPDSLKRIRLDCEQFLADAEPLITDESRLARIDPEQGTLWDYAGHDFLLTRNRHGAGYWDGDWRNPEADELTRLAEGFPDCTAYVGDDNMVHVS